MSMDAAIQCFFHAAAPASNLWLARRAVPEKASTSTASASMKPRETWRSRIVRPMSPSSFLTNFHVYTYPEA
eukprot:6625083-Pyramimonas_sp.AAC.1